MQPKTRHTKGGVNTLSDLLAKMRSLGEVFGFMGYRSGLMQHAPWTVLSIFLARTHGEAGPQQQDLGWGLAKLTLKTCRITWNGRQKQQLARPIVSPRQLIN